MLATATHDTKRGEDARARLDVLSELAEEWGQRLSAWARINAAQRTIVDGAAAPDRNDEYLFYQTLLGAWPPGAAVADAELVERLAAFASRRCARPSSTPAGSARTPPTSAALTGFVARRPRRPRRGALPAALPPLPGARRRARRAQLAGADGAQDRRRPACPTSTRAPSCGTSPWSIPTTAARSTTPFARACSPSSTRRWRTPRRRATLAGELLCTWPDGRIKLLLTTLALRLRREHAALFRDGDYTALEPRGRQAASAVGLARRLGDRAVVAVVPRLCAPLTAPEHPFPLAADWGDTTVALPDGLAGRPLRDVFTGAEHAGPVLPLSAVLSVLPVTILIT